MSLTVPFVPLLILKFCLLIHYWLSKISTYSWNNNLLALLSRCNQPTSYLVERYLLISRNLILQAQPHPLSFKVDKSTNRWLTNYNDWLDWLDYNLLSIIKYFRLYGFNNKQQKEINWFIQSRDQNVGGHIFESNSILALRKTNLNGHRTSPVVAVCCLYVLPWCVYLTAVQFLDRSS